MNKRKSGIALLLWICILLCGISAAADAEETWLSFDRPPLAGDAALTLRLDETLSDVKVNVFSEEKELAEEAVLSGNLLELSLKQLLCEGDELTILAAGTDADGKKTEARLTAVVPPLFPSPLENLRARADAMWEIWQESWASPAGQGKVYLPKTWKDLPFITWADEAPEIIVRREKEGIRVFLEDPLPDGWILRAGAGIPVVYTDCEWDEAGRSWTAKGSFDSVHLISEMAENRLGISISYWEADEFLPSFPVVEWVRESEAGPSGFNCYGLGNIRYHQGGIYSFVDPEHIFVAEYDAEGGMTSYTDMLTDCTYSAEDQLISGEEPAGYQNPVIH